MRDHDDVDPAASHPTRRSLLQAGLVALGWRPERRPLLAGVLVAGVVVGGALWFVWFYPWLSALPIPGSLAAYYVWLPTWQYGCQFYPTFRCT